MREAQRQRMARLQARSTALDSPLKVDISDVEKAASSTNDTGRQPTNVAANSASDLYAAAMKSSLMGQNVDQNGQTSKRIFQPRHQGSRLPAKPGRATDVTQ
ncbi:hypothetical protein ACOJBO_08690 [Rhizobium beringeri]